MVDHHILVGSCLFSVHFLDVTMPSPISMPQYILLLLPFPLPGMPSQCLLVSETFFEIQLKYSSYWDTFLGLGIPPKLSCSLYSKLSFLPSPQEIVALHLCVFPSLSNGKTLSGRFFMTPSILLVPIDIWKVFNTHLLDG